MEWSNEALFGTLYVVSCEWYSMIYIFINCTGCLGGTLEVYPKTYKLKLLNSSLIFFVLTQDQSPWFFIYFENKLMGHLLSFIKAAFFEFLTTPTMTKIIPSYTS